MNASSFGQNRRSHRNEHFQFVGTKPFACHLVSMSSLRVFNQTYFVIVDFAPTK